MDASQNVFKDKCFIYITNLEASVFSIYYQALGPISKIFNYDKSNKLNINTAINQIANFHIQQQKQINLKLIIFKTYFGFYNQIRDPFVVSKHEYALR